MLFKRRSQRFAFTPIVEICTDLVLRGQVELIVRFFGTLRPVETGRGAKTEVIRQAIDHQIGEFTLSDILQVCPGVSRETAKLAFRELAKQKKIVCLGKGKSAKWKKK